MYKTIKPNSISVSLWVLGISVAISAFLLISTRIHASHKAGIQNETAGIVTPQAQSTGIATATDEAIYTFVYSRRLYPVLTWSIAGILILASVLVITLSRKRTARIAIIATLYLLSGLLLAKSSAISYCTLNTPTEIVE